MIVAPMCWKKDEWIGLAIGCRLQPILQAFREGGKTWNESKHDLITGRKRSTCNHTSVDGRFSIVNSDKSVNNLFKHVIFSTMHLHFIGFMT